MNIENIVQYLIPVGIIICTIVLGWFFRTYVHRRLEKLTKLTKWQGDDVILKAVQSSSILWFFLAGVYFAADNSPIPDQIAKAIKVVSISVLILSITFALSKTVVGLLQLYSRKTEGVLQSTTMFTNMARIIIITIGLLVIFQTLGISITPVLTALGVGGLAVSFALKDTLSDFFAGLHILLSGKLKPGDLVALESGERGTVENISWRDTNIRDREDNLIVIPNSRVSTALITNFDVPKKEMVVRVSCGVSYDSDLEHVERVSLEVAKEVVENVPGGISGSRPFMIFTNFGESSIDFRVSMRATDYIGQYLVTHEFIKRLHKRFNEEGINIPFPIRTIYQANLNKS